MIRRGILFLCILLLAAATVRAELQVVDVADGAGVALSAGYYRVTDPGHWEVMVDKATGAVFSFRDLTDAGVPDGQGGVSHTNYTGTDPSGTDYSYHLRTPLLYVEGCSGPTTDRIFTLADPVTDLANRLHFALSPDRKSFTIAYQEDSASADYLWDPSTCLVDGLPAGARGDLLTGVTFTLHEADASGTIFRLVVTVAVSQPDFGSVNSRVFEQGWVVHCLRGELPHSLCDYEIHQTIDGENSRATGEWNAAAPRSFIRRTITGDNNNLLLGLTPGRTFVLDHVWGFENNLNGGGFLDGTAWGAHWLKQQLPRGLLLTDGVVLQQVVDLRISIEAAEQDPPPALAIAAGPDFDWIYQNAVAGDLVHKGVLTVAIVQGLLAEETYDVTIRESGGTLAHFQADLPLTLSAGGTGTVDLFGGRMNDAAASAGQVIVLVTVTGRLHGQSATSQVPLRLRALGDIDGSGSLDAADKLEMNKSLNGLESLPGVGLRDLDLTGDGLINAEDKLRINRFLNGLP